jgi:hypothetical protein
MLVAILESLTIGLVMLLARKKLHMTTTDRVMSVMMKMLFARPIFAMMLVVPPIDTIPRRIIGIVATKSILTISL